MLIAETGEVSREEIDQIGGGAVGCVYDIGNGTFVPLGGRLSEGKEITGTRCPAGQKGIKLLSNGLGGRDREKEYTSYRTLPHSLKQASLSSSRGISSSVDDLKMYRKDSRVHSSSFCQ